MTLPLLLALVPVQRIYLVSLGVLPKDKLHHVSLAEVVPLHYRIDDATAPLSDASAHPVCPFLFSHGDTVHRPVYHVQDMFNLVALWLRFVEQFGKIQVTITVFDREFVAGLSAQDGLLFREQRPTTQEPATSWVVAFLRCF